MPLQTHNARGAPKVVDVPVRSALVKAALVAGLLSAWRSFIWMAKIVIPASLLVALLQWSGWLQELDHVLGPLMSLLRLPPAAALPIVTGALVNIYGVLAAITVMPFSYGQMTLIAVFSLICHNLILEGVVQHRSGMNVFKATAIRFIAATATVFIVSRFFTGTEESVAVPAALVPHSPLQAALGAWASSTGILLAKVLGIIAVIMVLLEVSRKMGWIDFAIRFCRPVTRVFGLAERTTMMFVAGTIFGLLYGGAIIVEEARKGSLTKEEAEYLHVSLGINHGIVEDPALFAVLGLNLLWLLVPRMVTAILAVHVFRLCRIAWRRAVPV
jgi:hypothetical protein